MEERERQGCQPRQGREEVKIDGRKEEKSFQQKGNAECREASPQSPKSKDVQYFTQVLQSVAGAASGSVRHSDNPRGEKVFAAVDGEEIVSFLPRVVLGLSSLYSDELCKTLTTCEVLPLPLDSPFLLPQVCSSSCDVRFVLLSLIVGLNSLYGEGVRWEGPCNACQKRVLLYLLDESKRFVGLKGTFVNCSWAKFFAVKSIDYKGDEVCLAQRTSWANVAPALPDEVGMVPLESVCTLGCREYVLNFEHYLVPSELMTHTRAPRVMVDDHEWAEMCRGLLTKGVCTMLPQSQLFHVQGQPLLNGLFGVLKDEGSGLHPVHRLIMNLVPLNQVCRAMEGDVATLPAWPSMSPLILHPDENLVVSSEDVRCFFYSPNSGYTEGVLTVSVKAGVRSGYALWARGFVCAGMPF